MFCGLEEKRTRFRKKKRKKKDKEKKNGKKGGKNFIVAESELVGIKGYYTTYNREKYFLPNLSRF